MNNYTPFSPSGQSVDFTIGASTPGGDLHEEAFTTSVGGNTLYLRIRELNSTVNLKPGELEQGILYDIAAFTDPYYTTPQDISTWEGSNVNFVEAYVFEVDKRPLYVTGYATQTTDVDPRVTQTSGKICGVTNTSSKPYRRTPLSIATDADFLDEEKNGRINWINDEVKPAAEQGFERHHWINCGGHTNFNGTQLDIERADAALPALGSYVAMQPHYPSLVAGSMTLDNYTYIIDQDTLANAVVAPSPFTPSGQPDDAEGRGDSTKAWRSAVSYVKDLGAKEITSYQGYRAVFTDKNMTDPLVSITSLSAQSSSGTSSSKDRWSGETGSPGFCPEPGFDGVGGSALVDRMKIFWDDEIRGILNMGFNGIGLDTGTRVYDNSAGYANGDNSALDPVFGTPTAPNGTGNLDLINYFNSFGIKPVFEAVGLDTWTAGSGADAGPDTANNGERYKNSAYWAFFGSWWGYLGEVETDQGLVTLTDQSFSSSSSTPSGGRVYRDSSNGETYIGNNPLSRGKMPADSEVHVIVQWKGTHLNALLEGTGSDLGGKKVTWIGLKQILYDMHDAGLVVSASGHPTDSVEGITPEQFRQYILDLSNGLITKRPVSDVKIAEMTAAGGITLNTWASGAKAFTLTSSKSWDSSGFRGTIEANDGDFDIALPTLSNSVQIKSTSFVYASNQVSPVDTNSVTPCIALHLTTSDNGLDYYNLDKKVYMNMTVTGTREVYTIKLDQWGETGTTVVTLVGAPPPDYPSGNPVVQWTDSTQPTEEPFDDLASVVTIELWQEG